MSDEATWNGTLNTLRLDPLADNDALSGRSVEIASVTLSAQGPEPSGAVLLLLGLASACFIRKRR